MYVTKVKYEDFDGNEREDTLYFNLTKAELARLEMNKKGGLEQNLKSIMEAKDNKEIWSLFEEIVMLSYGVKSPDGKRFMKSPEILSDFTESNGYSEFIFSLFDADKAAEFVNSLVSEAKRSETQASHELKLV